MTTPKLGQLMPVKVRRGILAHYRCRYQQLESAVMTARTLEKTTWQAYFDRMAKALVGKRALIEVASLELGDQIEAEWVALLGVTYDPKSDVLEITLDGLEHLVPKPRQIFVDEGSAGLDSFEVIDHGGIRHIVRLREPLMLPAPTPAP